MAAKDVKGEEEEAIRQKLERSAWGIGPLIIPTIVMREAGFGEGKMNLTFENTGLYFRAENWARDGGLGTVCKGKV